MSQSVTLPRISNQALGLGQFAIDFLSGTLGPGPSEMVLQRTKMFHTDSVLCGASALALKANAPTVLREEALHYRAEDPSHAAMVLGSNQGVMPEKAVVANSAAVREWDSNGTNFGYRPETGHTAGEFGHNDFYPVVVAACQQRELDGATALKAMVLIDEIRGRLAEVFSLKTYKIDHVVHGAIASAAVYGALMGATAEEIESAIGMVVAHYIPWRAIRAGKQLSDSKGASAAISSECAVLSVARSMRGFRGPRDIFRNPESVFRFFEKTNGDSPFDLILSHSGDDFAVMGMHFKLGLYEHQSAGAIQGVIDLFAKHPELAYPESIDSIKVTAYEPAFGIIGDPAKRNPTTRQSADHSMVFIIGRVVQKAIEAGRQGIEALVKSDAPNEAMWKALMLSPWDYGKDALADSDLRKYMEKITFEHGGPSYDSKYPEGIPSSVTITSKGQSYESGFVLFPSGHARNSTADLNDILAHKFQLLGSIATGSAEATEKLVAKINSIDSMTSYELASLYDFEIAYSDEDYE